MKLTQIEFTERSGALFLIAILLFHEDGHDTKHTQVALEDIFNVISCLLLYEA